MRHSFVILVILLFCSLAGAQETDARMQTILHPDKNAPSTLQNKSFYGGKSFHSSSPAYTKNFYFTEQYSPKGFTTASYSHSSITPYATRDYSTTSANTKGRYEIPNATKKAVDNKTADTKESSDSNKGYSTREYTNTREYRERGKSQDSFDLKKKDEKPMTVDQVRELLNKNK
ncbi:MAG: hypothetical protein WCH43_12650 [Verrucomicrobiota bacterium]